MSTDSDPFSLQRLRELTHQKCVGTISESELLELSTILTQSAKHRAYYWEMISVDSQLQWDLMAAFESPDSAIPEAPALPSEIAETHRPGISSGRLLRLSLVAVAASVLIMFVISMRKSDGPSGFIASKSLPDAIRNDIVIGMITKLSQDTDWRVTRSDREGSPKLRSGDTIELRSGKAMLSLVGNSSAILQSPALLSVESEGHVYLESGEMTVANAVGEPGMVVETSEARIANHGESYSVGAHATATQIVVFDGEIDVSYRERNQFNTTIAHSKRVRAGQAVQVSNSGTFSRVSSVFKERPEARPGVTEIAPIITSVSDDITRDDFYSYYEIVAGGMAEDVKAFVDRPHQWNGVAEGMPEFLIGGDYVKTFNSDKIVEEINVELTIARACVLYILMDNRVEPPQWLKQSFKNLETVIGVDEIPMDVLPLNFNELGKGPGNSVDQTHSIWRKTIRFPGKVRLGKNGRLLDAPEDGVDSPANMYGIVAVGLSDPI